MVYKATSRAVSLSKMKKEKMEKNLGFDALDLFIDCLCLLSVALLVCTSSRLCCILYKIKNWCNLLNRSPQVESLRHIKRHVSKHFSSVFLPHFMNVSPMHH